MKFQISDNRQRNLWLIDIKTMRKLFEITLRRGCRKHCPMSIIELLNAIVKGQACVYAEEQTDRQMKYGYDNRISSSR